MNEHILALAAAGFTDIRFRLHEGWWMCLLRTRGGQTIERGRGADPADALKDAVAYISPA